MKSILILLALFCSISLQTHAQSQMNDISVELRRDMRIFDRKIERYLHSQIVRSEPSQVYKLEMPAGFGSLSYILKTSEFKNGALCSMAIVRRSADSTWFPVFCKFGKETLIAVGALSSRNNIVLNTNVHKTDDLYKWGIFKILREIRINELRSRFEAFSESSITECLKKSYTLRLDMLLYVSHLYHEEHQSYVVFRTHAQNEVQQLDSAISRKANLQPFIRTFPGCASSRTH